MSLLLNLQRLPVDIRRCNRQLVQALVQVLSPLTFPPANQVQVRRTNHHFSQHPNPAVSLLADLLEIPLFNRLQLPAVLPRHYHLETPARDRLHSQVMSPLVSPQRIQAPSPPHHQVPAQVHRPVDNHPMSLQQHPLQCQALSLLLNPVDNLRIFRVAVQQDSHQEIPVHNRHTNRLGCQAANPVVSPIASLLVSLQRSLVVNPVVSRPRTLHFCTHWRWR